VARVNRRGDPAGRLFFSFPSSSLGTPLPAKLSLATIFVPKYNLGTREIKSSPGNRVMQIFYKIGAIWIGDWGKDQSIFSFDNVLE
jgi:hypothetical protein